MYTHILRWMKACVQVSAHIQYMLAHIHRKEHNTHQASVLPEVVLKARVAAADGCANRL